MPNPIAQYTSGYAPMTQGMDHNPLYGTEGLPFTDNPVVSMMAQYAAPGVQSWMNQVGMTPMGLTGRNIADTMSNMRYTEHQDEVLKRMAARDRDSVISTVKGGAAMLGLGWDDNKQQGAETLADSFTAMSPMLAQSPELIDAATGGTSALGLAVGVTKGARYRADPMSGLHGTSTDETSHLVEGLHAAYFEGGKFDRTKTNGFSSTQVGALYDELQRRGMVTGIGSPQEAAMGGLSMLETGDEARFQKLLTSTVGATRAGEISQKAKAAGTSATDQLSSEELQKLAQTGEGSDAVRGFDVSKVKSSIDKYSKLTAAMRDIFGDAGHPNAPMAELMQGLESMTNGSLQHMSAGKAEMVVRQTYALSKASGVGIEGAMMMQQHAAHMASAAGLTPAAASDIGMAGLASLAAANSSGMGGLNQWGAMNSEQMSQAHMGTLARAKGSELTNRISAVGVLEEQLKEATGKGFAEDSNMGRMLAAAKEGRETFEHTDKDGKVTTKSILEFAGRKNLNEFKEELKTDSGGLLTERELRNQERDTFANQGYENENNGIGESVAKISSEETSRTQIAGRLRANLHGSGVKGDRKSEEALSERIAMYMNSSVAETPEKIKAIGDMIRESGMAGDMSNEQISILAGQQVSATNAARTELGLTNTVANAQLNSSEYQTQVKGIQTMTALQAKERSKLTGFGQSTNMVQNFVAALKGSGDDPADPQALHKAFAAAIGGVGSAEIAESLRDELTEFSAAQDEYDRLAQQQTELGVDEVINSDDTEEVKQKKRTQNERRKKTRGEYEQQSAVLGKARDTLDKEMRQHAGVAEALDDPTRAPVPTPGDAAATDPSRRGTDATAADATADGAPQTASTLPFGLVPSPKTSPKG